MKFNASLLRMPGASKLAASRLSTSAPAVDADDDRQQRRALAPVRGRPRARRAPPRREARRPSLRATSPRTCRPARAGRQQRPRARAPRLADLAGDGVARTGDQRRGHGDETGLASIGERRQQRRDRGNPGVRDGVSGAAAPAALFGDAEQRLAVQSHPRGDGGTQKAGEQQGPSLPAGADEYHRADDRANHGARHGHRSSRVPGERHGGVCRNRIEQRRRQGRDHLDDEILADDRRRPQRGRRRQRHGEVVVEPDRHRLHRRGDERRRDRRTDREPQVRRWNDRPAGTTSTGTPQPPRRR